MAVKRTPKDVIDVFSEDANATDVPARLHSFICKWHGRIAMVRAQYAPKGKESWKFVPHYWRIEREEEQPSPDEICSKSIELVEQHALRAGMDVDVEGARYRVVVYIRTDTGKELLKTCGLRIAYGEDGSPEFDDDTSEEKQNENVNFYRESMQDSRDQARQAQEFSMKLQSEYANSIKVMGEAQTSLLNEMGNMGAQISSIAQSIAAVTGASMQAITDASELYKASERKSTEIRKMEIDYEIAQLDNAASDRRFDASMEIVKTAAPLIVGQLLKVPPEVMQNMVSQAGAQAAGVNGAPEDVAIEAAQDTGVAVVETWIPGKKPKFDARGREFDEFDTREKLACFFWQLDAQKEVATRVIVGAELYDELRSACDIGVISTEKALRKFNESVRVLDDASKARHGQALIATLGQHESMFFLNIAQSVSD